MAKILLAEDDESLSFFLQKSLKRAGHKVTYVKDGLEAYEKIKSAPFDLLLTDLSMPGMDGVTLAKKVRAELDNIQIMFITGFSAVALEANEKDFDNKAEIVSKPFHLNDLVNKIEKALSSEGAPEDTPGKK